MTGVPVPHGKGRFGGRNPQFAMIPPITKLLCPLVLVVVVAAAAAAVAAIIMLYLVFTANSPVPSPRVPRRPPPNPNDTASSDAVTTSSSPSSSPVSTPVPRTRVRQSPWMLNWFPVFTRDTPRQHMCYSVLRQFRPSVCLSVTRVHCIQTAEHIVEILSLSDRPIILVFVTKAS